MTVVPLFCAMFIKGHHQPHEAKSDEAAAVRQGEGPSPVAAPSKPSFGARFNLWFNRGFEALLRQYDRLVDIVLRRPLATVLGISASFVASLIIFPLLGVAFFPRTDAGQFVINVKAPSGTRLELTESLIKRAEALIRNTIPPGELGMIVSNIGTVPGFSSIYTPNSGQHTAFIQVSLKDDHKLGSYEYMNRVRERLESDLPELSTYFQSGSLVDAVLNLGSPAPIDVQVSGSDLHASYRVASEIAGKVHSLPGVSDVYIPQDPDYPALKLDVDRRGPVSLD